MFRKIFTYHKYISHCELFRCLHLNLDVNSICQLHCIQSDPSKWVFHIWFQTTLAHNHKFLLKSNSLLFLLDQPSIYHARYNTDCCKMKRLHTLLVKICFYCDYYIATKIEYPLSSIRITILQMQSIFKRIIIRNWLEIRFKKIKNIVSNTYPNNKNMLKYYSKKKYYIFKLDFRISYFLLFEWFNLFFLNIN